VPRTKPIISIENVVATGDISQRVDLIEITRNFSEVQYNPKIFPGLVFRLKSPKTTTLIFNSGKMVCTGSKSEEMAIKAVQTVVERLRSKKINVVNEPVVQIQNIVSSINLGGRVNLEEAARQLPKSMYEPEQFPGLIHRMVEPKTVILIFASGKLVCTGAKKTVDVYSAVNNLHNKLEQLNMMMY